MKAALLQLNSGTDPQANFDAVAALADRTDASFLLTPEMTPLLQKDAAALDELVRGEDAVVAPYRDLASSRGIHLLLGSAASGATMAALRTAPF